MQSRGCEGSQPAGGVPAIVGIGDVGLPGLSVGGWLCPSLAVAGPPHAAALAPEPSAGLCPLGTATWSLPSARPTNKASRLDWQPLGE